MKQDTIQKALNIISERKRSANSAYEEKIAPLYSNKKFVETEKEYKRQMIENARKESYGEKVDRSAELKLKANLEQMKNNLKPNYYCQLCNDEGFKNGEMCVCLKKEISNILLKESGFEKLENFADSTVTAGDIAPVYHLMQKWCASDFKKNLIYLAGPTGVGKTYLIRCMANALIERGLMVKIATAYQINQDFKDFNKSFDDELLKKYTDIEVLFIDDLGAEPQYRNVTVEFFYLLINERKTKKLPTIITSNLDMGDLRDRYNERIYSRIADRETSITIYLDGDDKRIKQRKS